MSKRKGQADSQSSAPKYKWESPHEWLTDYLRRPTTKLLFEATQLAERVEPDEIQDMYQSEMGADGYFEEENA